MNTKTEKQPIGVMDSGLGGLSVLKEIIKLMPNEDYVYFGDSAVGSRSVMNAEMRSNGQIR